MANQETAYNSMIKPTGEATAQIEMPGNVSPIQVIGTEAIRRTFDEGCLQQAINSRLAPGVSRVVLNPDAHLGYGAPVGCVMVSPTHVYPGPVGVDIKCSMSLLQTSLPASEIEAPQVRRELIRAVLQRIPTGPGRGQRDVPRSRHVDERLGFDVATEGASKNVLRRLGIPSEWAERCEDAFHRAPDNSTDSLAMRLMHLQQTKTLASVCPEIQNILAVRNLGCKRLAKIVLLTHTPPFAGRSNHTKSVPTYISEGCKSIPKSSSEGFATTLCRITTSAKTNRH